MAAALPRLSWSIPRHGRRGEREDTRALFLSFHPCSSRARKAGVADQLNMSTTAGCGACACAPPLRARAVRGERIARSEVAAARRKEPAGEQKAATSDECLAYGLCGARYRRDRLEIGECTRDRAEAAILRTRETRVLK